MTNDARVYEASGCCLTLARLSQVTQQLPHTYRVKDFIDIYFAMTNLVY
jgi:hypothetical protein